MYFCEILSEELQNGVREEKRRLGDIGNFCGFFGTCS